MLAVTHHAMFETLPTPQHGTISPRCDRPVRCCRRRALDLPRNRLVSTLFVGVLAWPLQ
jgi:hypothetical protein